MLFGLASSPVNDAERSRLDALRRRIFEEMGRSGARWRLIWKLPFHLSVLGILALRGESQTRLTLQAITVFLFAALILACIRYQVGWLKIASIVVSIIGYFVLLATTGGLASPLLVTGALIMVVTAITQRDPIWIRPAAFLSFFVGFGGLALFAHTAVGELAPPLRMVGGWPSPEYMSITLLSAVFTMVGVYRVGCSTTSGYERAALEVAERREELCTENEDRSRALEGMAARLAHEVKNPLAAIKGLSTHMARQATDPKTAERLAIVAGEADRLQSIVDGFLSFSRGLDDLRPALTNLYDIAHELTVLLETRAQDAEIGLDVVGAAEIVIFADARQLRQALLNIVLNAIQASPRGSSVGIAVTRECGGARITVTDRGVGMTPDVLERIRKPYFTTKEGGTGLGVAVARGLIEQHGGRLEFRSAAGKGTTASLFIPASAPACQALPNLKAPSRSDGEARGLDPAAPATLNT